MRSARLIRATQSRDVVVVACFVAPLEVSITDSEAESCPSMHTAVFWLVVGAALHPPPTPGWPRSAKRLTTSRKPDSINASRSDDKLPLDVT